MGQSASKERGFKERLYKQLAPFSLLLLLVLKMTL
jgi:hypothetical protein